MSRRVRQSLAALALLSLLPAVPIAAAASDGCEDGLQSSGAVYRICMPVAEAWNGDLVLFAHGYVGLDQPIAIPEDQLSLPDGTSIPGMFNDLGFAFATSSYSTNGLAFKEGVADIRDLVDVFTAIHGEPRRVYLGGASEGGLVAALSLERYPDVYDGGLAACGPVGSFRHQVNSMGDFRVLFDYFFPEVLPGSVIDVPDELVARWSDTYEPAITTALLSDERATDQLLRVSHIPSFRTDRQAMSDTMVHLLWYNVFGASDGGAKLGGQPYDNSQRFYFGSTNDLRLNRQVERYVGEPAALDEIERYYETSGVLDSPLVTLHTTGDPVVPYWQEMLYLGKALAAGSGRQHVNIPVLREGHCNFKLHEVLAGFALMVLKSSGQQLSGVESVLPDDASKAEYLELARELGVLQ